MNKDRSKMEDAVIAFGDVFYMYHFANDMKEIDVKKMEDAIVESGNPCYIYLFARNILGADINRLENEIINLGNLEYMYYFVKNVEGSDTLKLKYEIAKILKRNKLTGATYLSIEDIVNSDNFYEFCECAVESKRRKSLVKKAKYHHWQ